MRATGVTLDIDVVTHSLASTAAAKLFALILVRSSRSATSDAPQLWSGRTSARAQTMAASWGNLRP